MAKSTWVQTNFNSGEWSPLAYGRFDIDKYKSGLSECLNFIPTQQGGLSRRPGTIRVQAVKDSTKPPRLVPFEFSSTQSYILEFGEYYIRFYVNGGRLTTGTVAAWATGQDYVPGDLRSSSGVNYYCKVANDSDVVAVTNAAYWYPLTTDIFEVPTPYTIAEVWTLDFAQKADTLYIACATQPPAKLQRKGAVNWIIPEVDLLDGPFGAVNTTTTTLSATIALGYGVGEVAFVASSTTGINGGLGFRAGDLGRRIRIKIYNAWRFGKITEVTDSTNVKVTLEDPYGAFTFREAQAIPNVAAGGAVYSIDVLDGGSGYYQPPQVALLSGSGTGTIAYAKTTNNAVTSIEVVVPGASHDPGTGVEVVFIILANTGDPTGVDTTFWRLGLWNSVDGYPSCVTFHQDRLCFSGFAGDPGRVDCSNTGDYENFAPSNMDGTVVDSNALAFTLSSGRLNPARWMISDEWGLIIGSVGGEWAIAPSSTQQALTPTNVNAKELSNYGSSDATPVRVGKVILFVQRTGRKLREMLYQFVDSTFTAADISLVGEHLTQGGLKQMAVQFAPQQIVWIVREDGRLVGMTYDRDQKIVGWHGHDIGGYYDSGKTLPAQVGSVAIIPAPSTQRDEVWLTAGRYINGAISWNVEIMSKMWEDGDDLEDSVFLDSSSTYSGAATSAITGLTWLVGETVGVLTNGAVHPDRVVDSSGEITLLADATKVQVGLKYTSRAKTLTIESGGTEGPSQGKLKRIHRVVMRFFQTMGLKIQSDQYGIDPYDIPTRTDADPMDVALALYSGDRAIPYEGKWDMEGRIGFETDTPLPCNITMLMAQLDTQENS